MFLKKYFSNKKPSHFGSSAPRLALWSSGCMEPATLTLSGVAVAGGTDGVHARGSSWAARWLWPSHPRPLKPRPWPLRARARTRLLCLRGLLVGPFPCRGPGPPAVPPPAVQTFENQLGVRAAPCCTRLHYWILLLATCSYCRYTMMYL